MEKVLLHISIDRVDKIKALLLLDIDYPEFSLEVIKRKLNECIKQLEYQVKLKTEEI